MYVREQILEFKILTRADANTGQPGNYALVFLSFGHKLEGSIEIDLKDAGFDPRG